MIKIIRIALFCTIFFCLLVFLSGCSKHDVKPGKAYFVSITEVVQKDVPIYIESIGNIYSLQTVQIRPQVGGIIQEAYVEQGQYVKKGDPLYKIDPRPYQAALDKAKAQLAKDTASLKFSEEQISRNEELVQKEYVAKLTYNQYVSQRDLNLGAISSDKADIITAELNLEWTKPLSPIDGKISQFNIDVGNLVIANDATALTDIRQIDPIEVRFSVTQEDFVEVQKAMKNEMLKLEAILPQDKDHPREGKIYFIDNHVDTSTGTILIKGTISNKDEFFWPGEFVRVRLQLRVQRNALLVPERAVKIGQSGPYVYIYKPETSTAEYRLIVKGETIDHYVVIDKGVSPEDKIILSGQNNLLPGAKVIIPSEDKSNENKKP